MKYPSRATIAIIVPNRAFWVEWTVASVLGWTVAGFMLRQLSMTFSIYGAVIGLAQWRVLRKRASRTGWWVLASALGWPVGWLAASTLGRCCTSDDVVFQAVGITLFMALIGAVTGIIQWVPLRRWVSRAGWWILAGAIGWAIFTIVAWVGREVPGLEGCILINEIIAVSRDILGSATYGIITGWTIVWLWRQPVSSGSVDDAAERVV